MFVRTQLTAVLAAFALLGAAPAVAQTGPLGADPELPTPTPPSLKDGSWIARILFTTNARSLPGAGKVVMRLTHYTRFTQGPHAFMVTDAKDVNGVMWVRIQLQRRPNGAQGWVSEEALDLQKTRVWIRVSIPRRKVEVFRAGKRIRSWSAAVGTGGTPTPKGLFAIYDPVPTSGQLGPYIFVLTAHSNVLKTFAGGNGEVGIHGWPSSSVLGQAVSHGCVRLSRTSARALATFAKPGVPVQIV